MRGLLIDLLTGFLRTCWLNSQADITVLAATDAGRTGREPGDGEGTQRMVA